MKKTVLLLIALLLSSFAASAASVDTLGTVDAPKLVGPRPVEVIAAVENTLSEGESEFFAALGDFYIQTFEAEGSEPFIVYGPDGQPLEEGCGQPEVKAAFLIEDNGKAYYIAD